MRVCVRACVVCMCVCVCEVEERAKGKMENKFKMTASHASVSHLAWKCHRAEEREARPHPSTLY